jgi:hypothetical protein
MSPFEYSTARGPSTAVRMAASSSSAGASSFARPSTSPVARRRLWARPIRREIADAVEALISDAETSDDGNDADDDDSGEGAAGAVVPAR